MTNRHLLPEEIDLLVDGDEGFGVAPLRTHLESCDDCSDRFVALRQVVLTLESLPHLAPRSRFADHVMSQVQVFEPWHVSARDNLRRFWPQSTFGRAFAGVTGTALAAATTMGLIWVAERADAVLFVGRLGATKGFQAASVGASGALESLLGGGVTSAGAGSPSLMVGVAVGLAAAMVSVAFGVKSLATAGRRRRS